MIFLDALPTTCLRDNHPYTPARTHVLRENIDRMFLTAISWATSAAAAAVENLQQEDYPLAWEAR